MKQDVLEPGGTYHIFNRGNNKEDIFKEEENARYFLSLLNKYLAPVADLYAYCLLKNHFHFLLRIKDVKVLPPRFTEKPYLAFSHLFNAYTKAFNKKYNRSGSLFQEHLKRKRVSDEQYLIQLIAYIHLNPEKHGFTSNFRNFKYSSFAAYQSTKPTNIDKQYIFSLVDQEVFEAWHDQKRLESDYLQNFVGDQT